MTTHTKTRRPSTPATIPNERELEALQTRDPEAIERWIYSQRDFLLRVLFRYAKTRDAAEDLLQETFYQAIRSLPTFRGDAKVSTWLYGIARNVGSQHVRKQKRITYHETAQLSRVAAEPKDRSTRQATNGADPADAVVKRQEYDLLYDALQQLRPSYRKVVQLRDLEERSTREVAAELELTSANVRVRLYRARKRLRALLQPQVEEVYSRAT